MRILISLLSVAMVLVALVLYIRVRRYLNRHGEEEVAQHAAWLMRQMRIISALSVAAALLSLLRIFF